MSEPLSYSYTSVAQEVVCAADAISGFPGILDRAGVTRAMVVCGPSILEKSDVVRRVQSALGDRCVDSSPEWRPTLRCTPWTRPSAWPGILSPMGWSAWAEAAPMTPPRVSPPLLGEGGTIHDHQVIFEPPDRIILPEFSPERAPIIAVSTTMGAAELSRGAGFADKDLGRKMSIADPGTIPRYIVIDGQALATTPMSILLSTGMGQLRIAVESVYSNKHNPISDSLALQAISMLVKHLPQCPELEIDCLLNTKTAAAMASLGSVGCGINTATAHHVGGLYDVPHGDANAIMLPHSMRFNAEASADRQTLIA